MSMFTAAQKRRKKKEIDRIARHLATNHQPQKAIERIDTYLRDIDSTDVELLVLKGNIYDSRGMFSEAKKTYETVLHIEPHNIKALTDLGEYYSCCEHDYRRALRYFDRALHLLGSRKFHADQENEFVDVCTEKASALIEFRQPLEALKCVVEGLRKFPTSTLLSDSLQQIQERFHRSKKRRRASPPRPIRSRLRTTP